MADSWLEASLYHELGGFRLAVDLAMDREIGILFGPSGSGKSLTLRLLAGLGRPRRGRVVLGGATLHDSDGGVALHPSRRGIGLVFQELALFPHMTARQNVAYGLRGVSRASALGQADRWLHRLHLQGMEGRYPGELSGGQQQRVALARALAAEPALLLLDEPFSALDGPLRRSLRRTLKELHRETGVPMLYVTHQIEDVCALGDRIFFLREGTLSGSLPVESLWRGEAQDTVWQALQWGNLLEGEVIDTPGGPALRWKDRAFRLAPAVRERGERLAFIAPHDIKLLYPGVQVDPTLAPNVVEGTVVERLDMGSTVRLTVEGAGIHWHVEYPGNSYRNMETGEGARVLMAFRCRDVTVLDRRGSARDDLGGSGQEDTEEGGGMGRPAETVHARRQ
ncbi:MAG: ABC transporter ATP-binding protein [Synergistales bacterium]|nr:ABC transporter ATP-binding protein [Synergistales bacterium]